MDRSWKVPAFERSQEERQGSSYCCKACSVVLSDGSLPDDMLAVLFMSTAVLYFVIHHLLPAEVCTMTC